MNVQSWGFAVRGCPAKEKLNALAEDRANFVRLESGRGVGSCQSKAKKQLLQSSQFTKMSNYRIPTTANKVT